MTTDGHNVPPEPPSSVSDDRERVIGRLPVTERRLQLAGVSTAVLEGGSGPPLILLHGPGEFAGNWCRVIPHLVNTNRVIAPDLPGHGASTMANGALDEDGLLAWVGGLIDRTCCSPPALVGHILGGAIAARFAVRQSDRLRRLVLVDSLGLAPFRPAPAFALTMAAFLVRPTERSYTRFMRQCSYDLDNLREQMGDAWEPYARYNLSSARGPGAKIARQMMRRFGVPAIPPDDLARISVPTSLIWGRHDRANRLRVAEAARARYGWPLSIVEGCADDPARDRPTAFLEALREALTGDPRTPAFTKGAAHV